MSIRSVIVSGLIGVLLIGNSDNLTKGHQPSKFDVNPEPLELIDQFGGASYAVAISGNTVFLGVGTKIISLDVSIPSTPRQIGRSPLLPSIVQVIEVTDGIAYVALSDTDGLALAGSQSYLAIIDITNPTSISVMSTIVVPGDIQALEVAEGFAYLAIGTFGIRIMDVRDVYHPTPVSELEFSDGAYDVYLAENSAYVACRSVGLRIVDISTPMKPIIISTIKTSGFAMNVVVGNGIGYLTNESLGSGQGILDIVDVRDSMHPQLANTQSLPYVVEALQLANDRLYTVGDGFIHLFDVGPDFTASVVSGGAWPGLAYDLSISGTTILVAAKVGNVSNGSTNPSGLRVITQESNKLLATGRFATIGWVGRVQLSSHWVALAGISRSPRLEELFILNRMNPLDVADASDGLSIGRIQEIGLSEQFSFVASWNVDTPIAGGALRVVDIGSPTPKLKSSLDIEGAAQALDIAGDIVYVGGGTGLTVVNMSDKSKPVILAQLANPDNRRSITLRASKHILYLIASGANGSRTSSILVVIDATSPSQLEVLDIEQLSMGARDMEISENRLYVTGSRGLIAFDISDPAHPRSVGQLYYSSGMYDLATNGQISYVLGGTTPEERVLIIVDNTILPIPKIAFEIPISGAPVSIAIKADTVVIGAGSAGLLLYKISGSPQPTPTDEGRIPPTLSVATSTPPVRTTALPPRPELFLPNVHGQ